MHKNNESKQPPHKATVMLVSGELDKAVLVFEIAVGMQAMDTEVKMWFVLYGVNCLKCSSSRLHRGVLGI
jgi:peroxiredoxin family protein